MNFGDNLKTLRDENGLTQKELGKHLGMTKANISKMELGLIEASFSIITAIAELFDVSIDYLLGKSNIRNPYKNETIAANRTDAYDSDLPDEAKEELNIYIEFLQHKYKK